MEPNAKLLVDNMILDADIAEEEALPPPIRLYW